MLNSAPARWVFLVGLLLGLSFMGAAFFADRYNVFLFTIGLFVFVTAFFTAHLIRALLEIREEELRRKRNMEPCENCEALLYPEETSCPYCKTRRPQSPSQ